MQNSTATSSRKGAQCSRTLLYRFIHVQTTLRPILGRRSSHPFPLAEGWVMLGSLGWCPPDARHKEVTLVLLKS